MADEYVDLGFPDQADPATKLRRALDDLQAGVGYQPGALDPLQAVLERCAEMAADNESLMVLMLRAAVRWIGVNIDGVPYIDATPANAVVLVTAGAAGAEIEAGVTSVSIDGLEFVAADDTTIAASATVPVTFTATTPGIVGNDRTGTVVPITPLAAVTSWVLSSATSDGTDAETDDAYEDRWARSRRTVGRPVMAEDFEVRMLDNPLVFRALALDGYNLTDGTSDNEKTTTLIGVDKDGGVLSAEVKNERKTAITAQLLVGWELFMGDPSYTEVAVDMEVNFYPGVDETAGKAAVADALTAYLNPATYGATPTGEAVDWNFEPVVYRNELITEANNVPGVRHVTPDSVLINGVDDDLTLTGIAPLPTPGTMTITTPA